MIEYIFSVENSIDTLEKNEIFRNLKVEIKSYYSICVIT
jgi:hypothetical protein